MMKKMICTLPMLAAYFALTACGGSGSDNHMVSDNSNSGGGISANTNSTMQNKHTSANTDKNNSQQQADTGNTNNATLHYTGTPDISKPTLQQTNPDVNKKLTLGTVSDDEDEKPEEEAKDVYIEFNGHQFKLKDNKVVVDFGVLPAGLSNTTWITKGVSVNDNTFEKLFSMRSYNQFFSTVGGAIWLKQYKNGVLDESESQNPNDKFEIETIAGQPTPIANLPAQGSATYEGLAFTENAQGNFKYTINFADRTGAGKITGLNAQDIDLLPGHLASAQEAKQYQEKEDIAMNAAPQTLFLGNTSPDAYGDYMIGLYGPHAEEATGAVKNNEGYWAVGVGGKRGAIQ